MTTGVASVAIVLSTDCEEPTELASRPKMSRRLIGLHCAANLEVDQPAARELDWALDDLKGDWESDEQEHPDHEEQDGQSDDADDEGWTDDED